MATLISFKAIQTPINDLKSIQINFVSNITDNFESIFESI